MSRLVLSRKRAFVNGLFGAVIVGGGLIPLPSASGQQIAVIPGGGASYDWDADTVITGENHLITSIPGIFTGVDVAPLIGANTFYANGYTGGSTIASNVEAGHIWQGHESLGHVTQRVNQA